MTAFDFCVYHLQISSQSETSKPILEYPLHFDKKTGKLYLFVCRLHSYNQATNGTTGYSTFQVASMSHQRSKAKLLP